MASSTLLTNFLESFSHVDIVEFVHPFSDKELGLSKALKINVFDTPGFADADISNIRKNKLLIGTSLKYNIHLVIFLTANPRFDQNLQNMLNLVNDWTLGHVWSNLLVVKGRTMFDKDSVAAR